MLTAQLLYNDFYTPIVMLIYMQTQNRDVELVLHLASLKSVESEIEE